jgi:hypothetical protein
MAKRWSKKEVQATVQDYFTMLDDELHGRPYNKTDHRKNLVKKLDDRNEKAIEFKHCNISAVLMDIGLPFIDGHKPRKNYQQLLYDEVVGHLDLNPNVLRRVESEAEALPRKGTTKAFDYDQEPVDPPAFKPQKDGSSPRSKPSFVARKFNIADKEAINRKLGYLGEKFVLEWEKHRLVREGRSDLAAEIEWTSEKQGNGAGYDIKSFEADGSPRYIAVKTTNFGKSSRFLISRNEVAFSDLHSVHYHLYRVYNFSRDPKLFILSGVLHKKCELQPAVFQASF